MIIELADFDAIKDDALRKFEERVSSAMDNRDQLELEAFRLESQLEQLYSFTAAAARREDDMGATAQLWEHLVTTCDLFANRLLQLSKDHSIATTAHDHILDIRSAAEELRALHGPA